MNDKLTHIEKFKKLMPDKFLPEDEIFKCIKRGSKIFVATGCAEPQYTIKAMVDYVEKNPKAIFDAEVMHVWSLGLTPYTDSKFKKNFRQNSFFVANSNRDAVNSGMADYTPIFLSEVPDLFKRGIIPVDVAIIQVSPPDEHGYVSMGISVDIVRAATNAAKIIIAQMNVNMPRVHGDSFIHLQRIQYVIHHDEPLLEYHGDPDSNVIQKIGQHVSNLIQDGDTIQVGYGSIPNAILANLNGKKNLGVHTELFTDGLVNLIKSDVINNKLKTVNPGKTVASFCMGSKETYQFLDNNPSIEFQPINVTNSPLNIAKHEKMVAINSGLQIDLTGQATAESLGSQFYSGIGGQADFMRGAVLAPRGRTILTIQSTAENETISRIVPFLSEGAGTSLIRGDIHYVVTEFGIAYLHGKNIRERTMELIGIAHPKFRANLLKEAKRLNLIYKDQAFIPGKRGEYPEDLAIFRTTKKNFGVMLRPIKPSDESNLKSFFYSLSDESLYKRFISNRRDMPHERLQEFAVIDYTKEMVIIATVMHDEREVIVGVGQYGVHEPTHTAEVAFIVRDEYQNNGIGSELLSYLTQLAQRKGLLGFTAEVLSHNKPMLHLFEKMGFEINQKSMVTDPTCKEMKMRFKN
ncbi:MAG: acetyl-CoA hydrolase [Bdellovibrionales bacterium RIFOXYB1_FULL_37_110]|nr:MAG: acetyl-CoA hydrolase [Bdellovibrionales bacterium RIFOXYC1_FULL_37_79]OFZ57101.1 MAG: acetyl-CoA hydrolase [Bdellovibrionales bacterium RIFOXYB1_FULL_37_110]